MILHIYYNKDKKTITDRIMLYVVRTMLNLFSCESSVDDYSNYSDMVFQYCIKQEVI